MLTTIGSHRGPSKSIADNAQAFHANVHKLQQLSQRTLVRTKTGKHSTVFRKLLGKDKGAINQTFSFLIHSDTQTTLMPMYADDDNIRVSSLLACLIGEDEDEYSDGAVVMVVMVMVVMMTKMMVGMMMTTCMASSLPAV